MPGVKGDCMKINRLYLSDFRGIEELVLDLQGKSAILFGINGVGKSTILSAINLLYAPILNKLTRQKVKQAGNIELSDIKSGKALADISAEYLFGEEDVFTFERGITFENKRIVNNTQLESLVEHYETLYVGKQWVDEDNNLLSDTPDPYFCKLWRESSCFKDTYAFSEKTVLRTVRGL